MSNYLAIATVTATLQRIVQAAIQVDIPGAIVTTVRPETSGSKIPEVGVNIFLYQANPNPAWRNHDLRNRRPKGDLIKKAQAGLDLFYIMSFYGNEVELEPQRLFGRTIQTIVDNPILTSEIIRETVNNSNYSYLATSTLEQQIERVTIVPSIMTTDDLSKIWSVFFQSPYVLSFAFQGGAVLIEGMKPAGRALPVRDISFYTTPSQPVISQVQPETGANQLILANSSLLIRGNQLQGESARQGTGRTAKTKESALVAADQRASVAGDRVQVRIGDAKLTPHKITDKEIRVCLSSLSVEEAGCLRSGVQSLQVLHPVSKRMRYEPDRVIGSNVVPLVLCPRIKNIELLELKDNLDGGYSTEVRIEVDFTVGVKQRALFFLNKQAASAAYIFNSKSRNEDTNVVVFPVHEVEGGEYLVRVQIDGAESPLEVDTNPESDTFENYINPIIIIG